MKNFIQLDRKKKNDKDIKGVYFLTTWKHTPTNNILYEYQYTNFCGTGEDYHYYSALSGGTANLKFWIDQFFKHPIQLGK